MKFMRILTSSDVRLYLSDGDLEFITFTSNDIVAAVPVGFFLDNWMINSFKDIFVARYSVWASSL